MITKLAVRSACNSVDCVWAWQFREKLSSATDEVKGLSSSQDGSGLASLLVTALSPLR